MAIPQPLIFALSGIASGVFHGKSSILILCAAEIARHLLATKTLPTLKKPAFSNNHVAGALAMKTYPHSRFVKN
ncbi:MAG TPA: hypothetical protein IGR89_16785 [Oscillatoriaceae cyanobacterium M7585_C2015_266]|nr:hypothetical protein [Oscillatoriaceae cyanobacterium M7585_C2015_266]